MSTSPETTNARKGSSASRYFFLFLVGLAIGAIGVVMLMRAWEGRKTPEDRWHDAVMTIMAVHSGRLDANIKANRCAATDVIPSLQAMRTLANDIEPAFPDLADDARFKTAAGNYRASLDAALAAPPMNCAGAQSALKSVGDGCKACHQDFRN